MAAPSPALILIADDTADNREMYAEYLAFVGYRVETADNGITALSLAKDLRPEQFAAKAEDMLRLRASG